MITDYQPEYKAAIKELNEAWLEKYFTIEPIDTQILSDPETEILAKGGRIFYAWNEGKIVGTVSLIKIDDQTFELSKMAVSEESQGLGLGKKLMEHALNKAKEMNATKVIIYSNTRLGTAIALYRKYGFTEVNIENNHYERCNIMMEKFI